MKILFIHQNFPAQFKNLAPALVALGHSVTALTLSNSTPNGWNGVKVLRYGLARGNTNGIHPWIVDYESKVVRGEACLRYALDLKKSGYNPDIIIAHPGWGESLFLKQVWPSAILKIYCEFFYHSDGYDVGFDKELVSQDEADFGRVILKNSNILLHFEHAHSGITPTNFQASSFPEHIQRKISVIHEGINTDLIKPNHEASVTLSDGRILTVNDEIVTYVNRSLEPMRGIHTFLRSVPRILKDRPNSTILVVGEESYSGYGSVCEDGKTWKAHFFDEIKHELDSSQESRIIFCGRLPYETLIALYQVSSVHIYLSYPFVLSWSLLEAMSAGCVIVGSDTPPVREVISHDINGWLVDFFNPSALVDRVSSLLDDHNKRKEFSAAARKFVELNYDLQKICLPNQINWALSVD